MGKYSDRLGGGGYTIDTTANTPPEKWSSKLGLGGNPEPQKQYVDSPNRENTGAISTITGKPEEQYVSTDYKAADFKTLVQAGYIDDNQARIDHFAKARGISPDLYEVKDGKIWFEGEDGRMYPETPKEVDSLFKKLVAELPSQGLADIGAGMGAAIGGIPGAAVGAAGGEWVRKTVGKEMYGDKQTSKDYGVDMFMQALSGGFDAGLGKIFSRALNTSKIKKATGGKLTSDVAKDVVGDIPLESRGAGKEITKKGQGIGVDLKPHQAMDDPALTSYYSMLRDNPKTARAVRAADNKLEDQTFQAGEDLIKDISPRSTDAFEVGNDLVKAGDAAIQKMKQARGDEVKGLYAKANEVDNVDIGPALEEIASLKEKVKPGMKAHSALNRIERMLTRGRESGVNTEDIMDPFSPDPGEIKDILRKSTKARFEAQDNILKNFKKEDETAYRKIRDEAEEIVNASGDFADWREAIDEGGINLETAYMTSDKETVKKLMRLRPGLFKKGGPLHAEHFANRKGFDSPDELFQSWLDGTTRKDAIDLISKGMIDEYDISTEIGRSHTSDIDLHDKEIDLFNKGMLKKKPNTPQKKARSDKIAETRLEVLDNVKQEIDAILSGKDSSSITNKLKRKMQGVKDILTAQIDKVSPEYQKARALFTAASPEITKTEKGIVGVLSRMTTDEIKEKAVSKIFSSRHSVRTAKKALAKDNPELWADTVAEYMRSGFENIAKKAQGSGGKVLNRAGKYTKKWDYPEQRKLEIATEGMLDGAGEPLYGRIKDFFEVMEKASIGMGKESATQSRLKMEKSLQGTAGKINSVSNSLRQSVSNFFLKGTQERAFDKNAKKLLELMQTPEGVDLIAKAKGYGANTQKGIEAITTFILMAAQTNAGKIKEIIGSRDSRALSSLTGG